MGWLKNSHRIELIVSALAAGQLGFARLHAAHAKTALSNTSA
ncbi:hypothetical protein [Rhodococcoides fascians]